MSKYIDFDVCVMMPVIKNEDEYMSNIKNEDDLSSEMDKLSCSIFEDRKEVNVIITKNELINFYVELTKHVRDTKINVSMMIDESVVGYVNKNYDCIWIYDGIDFIKNNTENDIIVTYFKHSKSNFYFINKTYENFYDI